MGRVGGEQVVGRCGKVWILSKSLSGVVWFDGQIEAGLFVTVHKK